MQARAKQDSIALSTAANGLAWITTPSRREYLWLSLILVFRYGFIRWGWYVPAISDEAIFPDYMRWGLRIHAGWDNWMGYDLLAANERSDVFLRRFYVKHCSAGA